MGTEKRSRASTDHADYTDFQKVNEESRKAGTAAGGWKKANEDSQGA
jgi:hypothetical protein